MKQRIMRDWKIKDKVYIIINIINKRIIEKNLYIKLIDVKEVTRAVKKISKVENISTLEALQKIIDNLHNNPDNIKLY